MTEPKWRTAARTLFQKHRRRLATLALMLFLTAVAIEIGGVIPRDTRVAYALGAQHAEVAEARIDYMSENETVQSHTLRWNEGAPSVVRQNLELTPGDYDVSVTLVEHDGTARQLSGRVTAPSDGVVHVALHGS